MRKSVQKQPFARWSLHGADGERKYLNDAERRRFIEASRRANPLVKTLCLTLVHTGCRLSEALALTAGDIDAAAGVVAIRSLKKRGVMVIREVPACPALFHQLARVHDMTDPDRELWPWGRTRGWQMVKQVMAAAGVTHLPASPKGLRHGFGVHAMRSGVPLHLIQRWLGHVDMSTTAIYLNVLGADERAIAQRMWTE